jgi:hypothetical protein
MFGNAFNLRSWSVHRLTAADVRRGVAAGTVWGVAMTVGLTLWKVLDCGVICLPKVAETGVRAIAAGILGIGAVAAYGGRR